MLKFVVPAFLLASPAAFALNGLRPIGVSAESNALGGTGISNFYNYYDALYKNPAMMANAPGRPGQSQGVFGMTYGAFNPEVRSTTGSDQDFKKPINDTAAAFPSAFGIGNKLSNRFAIATGFYGGGGGADYGEKADSVYRAKSATKVWSLTSGLSFAFAKDSSVGINLTATQVDTHASNLSPVKGVITETGGTAYTYGTLVGWRHQVDKATFGAIYQPRQNAYIQKARDIENDGIKNDLSFTAVPSEFATGVTWREDEWMIEVDYRFLQWSQAEFLKSVGWKDQHVLALGYEYGTKNRLRLGFNVSTDAVSSRGNTDGFATSTVSGKQMINLAADAFATTSGLGVTNKHYTIGSSHELSEALKLNSGVVYMVPGSITRTGSYAPPTGARDYGWTAKFSGFTAQLDLTYLW
jgi:hypothetical protein